MKLSYQRGRDLFLLTVGSLVLLHQFLVAQEPNSTIVIAAIGLFASPAFLKQDEKEDKS